MTETVNCFRCMGSTFEADGGKCLRCNGGGIEARPILGDCEICGDHAKEQVVVTPEQQAPYRPAVKAILCDTHVERMRAGANWQEEQREAKAKAARRLAALTAERPLFDGDEGKPASFR